MTSYPFSVSATSAFILLNALIWFAFGVIIAVHAHPALPDSPLLQGSMAFLSLVTTGVLLGMAALLRKRNRIVYYLAIGLFLAIALIILLDDFGLSDLVVLAVDLIPLVLLIKDRAWYLR